MAKSVDLKIKIDGKQLDLTKISFKDFDKIIKDAKKSLKDLPLTDPRYKQLAGDIKTAEKAWKEATKSAAEFNDENKEGAEDIKTYSQQIREQTRILVEIEQQYGKNSKEYEQQAKVIAELREEQEDLIRGTQQLDDTLAQIPGPIGQAAQAFKGLEDVGKNAKAALGQLGLGFKTLDGAIKTTGIGLLVVLFAGLVAAVVKAAQSFKPLQDAFAGLQDAFGSIMSALKPVTDFILNVFVGALNILSDSIKFVAEAFGASTNSINKDILNLERSNKKIQDILERQTNFITERQQKQLQREKEYNEKLIQLDKDKQDKLFENEEEYQSQKLLLQLDNQIAIAKINREFEEKNAKAQEDLQRQSELNNAELITNVQQREQEIFDINAKYDKKDLDRRVENQGDILRKLKKDKTLLTAEESKYLDNVILLEEKNYNDLLELQKSFQNSEKTQRNRIERENSEERRKILNQNILDTKQAQIEQIKVEEQLQLEQAKLNIDILKEQNRQELKEIEFNFGKKSAIYISTQKRQQEQLDLANEKLRLAQIEFDASLIQLEIDKQNRLVVEAGIGTQKYFDARKEIINQELQKELLLADGNQNKIEEARTKYWKALIDLDKEGIQAQINQLNIEYDGLYEGTAAFFEKQRQLEIKNFELRKAEYRDNYEALEALNKEHQKKMALIDASEIQNRSDMEMRKFAAIGMMQDEFFDLSVRAENSFYEAEKKRAGDNNALLEVIELEHLKRLSEIDAQRVEATLSVYAAIGEITSNFGNFLMDLAQNQLEASQGMDKQRFESAKRFAKAAVIVERVGAISQIVANTGIANSKAVAASFITGGQPWVTINTVSAALSIAGVIASAVQSINQIDSQKFDPSGGGGNRMGRGYEKGGMIEGKRHAQGGTMVEAEDGEAIMTRGAVTMFGPLLSMMNQAGGGTSFNIPNGMVTLPDNPNVTNATDKSSMIMKTYVVENELTSMQQRQARLKDLSTL